MKPVKFLLSLLPFAVRGLGSSKQCGLFEQNYSSTGVDSTELLFILSRMTLTSRQMCMQTLRADEQIASATLDKLIGDISIQSYTLVSFIPRLEATAPFESAADRLALATTFAKWQIASGSFLVALYKSSETFPHGVRYGTSRLASELADFKNNTAEFCRLFRAVMSTTELAPIVGFPMAATAAAMDSIFENTIRKLKQESQLRA